MMTLNKREKSKILNNRTRAELLEEVELRQRNLTEHKVYEKIYHLENLKRFMEFHVFAVWDFMSLLKSLQRRVTVVDIPWRPSLFSGEMVRLINEIVVGEESDKNEHGGHEDHFSLYLRAMEEVGASTEKIRRALQENSPLPYLFQYLPPSISAFNSYHFHLALEGSLEEVAGAFFYGREKLIPAMFRKIVMLLGEERKDCPALIHYLIRHIGLDEEEHGPMAQQFLLGICGEDEEKWRLALSAAILSLDLREKLWDETLLSIGGICS